MKIGLFFGSFNPIHVGHLMIANFILQQSDLQKIWFVVSPQNPFKEKKSLLNEYDRLHLIQLAIEDNPKFKACDIEFKLPKPSYTIDTLTHLSAKFPSHQFSILMGGDNLESLNKWKNYEKILAEYPIYVYKRSQNQENPFPNFSSIHILEVPYLDISATFIRENLRSKKSMKYFLSEPVWDYIDKNNLYK